MLRHSHLLPMYKFMSFTYIIMLMHNCTYNMCAYSSTMHIYNVIMNVHIPVPGWKKLSADENEGGGRKQHALTILNLIYKLHFIFLF